MIKKILLAIMLLLPTIVLADSWKLHQLFSENGIKNHIDAANCVYMLVDNSLSRFDKATGEIQTLKSTSGLTEDMQVSQIYYNYDKHYLLVVYINSNIDVIKSDGSVVNVPAVHNMHLQGCTKEINDVNFSNNAVYISTSFGYVTLDAGTLETREYRNYGKSFRSITRVGGTLVAAVGDSLYSASTLKPGKFSDFKAVSLLGNRSVTAAGAAVTVSNAKLYNINDSERFFLFAQCTADSAYMKRCQVTTDGGIATTQLARYTAATSLINIQKSYTGFLWNFTVSNAQYLTTNALGEAYKAVNGKRKGIYSCSPEADGELWGLGTDGLFKNSASDTLYKPNAISFTKTGTPYWASYNSNSGKLYLTYTAPTTLLKSSQAEGCVIYDGQTWTRGGYTWGPNSPAAKKTNHCSYRPLIDLAQPSTHYVGTWYCGMIKVVNDTVAAVYDEDNSPVVPSKSDYYRCIHGYGFDSQHNLWMVQSMDNSLHNTNFVNAAMVLPADKLEKDVITADDWKSYAIPGTVRITSSQFNWFAIGRGDVKVYTPGNGGSGNNYLLCWRGDLDSEPEVKQHKTVTDQFGTSISCGINPVLASDSTGLIWVGGNGIFSFDPTTAFGDALTVTRPRTSSGDFMLSGIGINHIEVDHLNRKWVSTNGNGIYLLNPECTEVLKQFDSSNSDMPSGLVYSSCAMGTTGHVMIMTGNGVVEYSENDEATTIVSNFEVFPTLVTPDFTGMVTINGVARGSLIRITDYEGNTVSEFTTDGTTATWDCSLDDGNRVPTGVYNIYVAADGQQMPAEPQATIRVIR